MKKDSGTHPKPRSRPITASTQPLGQLPQNRLGVLDILLQTATEEQKCYYFDKVLQGYCFGKSNEVAWTGKIPGVRSHGYPRGGANPDAGRHTAAHRCRRVLPVRQPPAPRLSQRWAGGGAICAKCGDLIGADFATSNTYIPVTSYSRRLA